MKKDFYTNKYLYSLIVFIILCGALFSWYSYTTINVFAHAKHKALTDTISYLIPASQIAALQGNSSDLTNPAYVSLKATLTNIRQSDAGTRFVYIVGQNSSGIFFYVDSEDPSSPDYSPPGQKYTEAPIEFSQTFQSGTASVDTGTVSDRWGTWYTAISPIIDPKTSTVVAAVAVDESARQWVVSKILFTITPLLLSFLIVLIILFLYSIGRRNRDVLEFKSRLVSVASYELRAPIIAMLWASKDLEAIPEVKANEHIAKMVGYIETGSERLLGVINSILDFSQWNKLSLQENKNETIDVIQIINEIATNMLLIQESRHIEISIDKSLPQSIIISGNKNNMQHIFNNLLSNAVKYSLDNSVVKVCYSTDSIYHTFTVIDHGIGIPESDQSKVFDGFFRAKNSGSVVGSGLGLALVKNIVNAEGGYITLKSKEHEGTSISVSFLITKL